MLPTRLPIIKPVPYSLLLSRALEAGLLCAGGFPLWLAGGASHYTDIDLYATTWEQWHEWHKKFRGWGRVRQQTPETTVFDLGADVFQLVKPVPHQVTNEQLLAQTDLTPSACALLFENEAFQVLALYPDDIANRVCRVLINHDWIEYRLLRYAERGYFIIRPEKSQSQIPPESADSTAGTPATD